MITAEIYIQGDGKITGFNINGHANTAPRGQDIYCAGVSALSQSVAMCIMNYLRRDVEGDMANGRLMIKLKKPPDALTEVAFQSMLIGIREIEKLAPQALKVIEIENSRGGESNASV